MADGSSQALNRKILFTGASSQIGVFAIPRLLTAGFEVVAVSRQKKPSFFPESDRLDWCGLIEALQSHSDCQYLLSAGPLGLAKQAMRKLPDINRAVIFSSSSVIAKLESADHAERQLMQAMLNDESELEDLATQKGAKLTIFRPTLIYGCGMDGNVSRLSRLIKRFSFMPVNGKAEGLRQPVHADDLAWAAVSALQTQAVLPAKMILTGGSTISYTLMLKAIFAAFNKPARIIHLPQWMLLAVFRLMKATGTSAGINAAMIKRQRQHLLFDDQQARDLLNYQPREFRPHKKDFELPDSQSQATN